MNIPATLIFILVCGCAKGQTIVNVNDVVNYVGKEVTLCDSVYSARVWKASACATLMVNPQAGDYHGGI